MSYPIKQSSTQAPLLFFMTLSSDHITGATGLTPTVTISKDGGAFASPSGAVSEIANGWYKVAGNATDTGTLGPIALHATAATADPCDLVAGMVVAYDPQDAVHLGLSAIPNTACTTNASLLTSGTGTDQLSVSAGKVLLQATQTGVTIPTVTTVTNQLTAAAIATGVWQDTTSGDFTVASSIGKSLFTSGAAPGAAGGLVIAGSNAATTFATLTSTGAFTVNGVSNVSQTGDSFARIGSTGSGLTSLAQAASWTSTLATNLGTLAGHDPGATLASTTNITAGTISTVTNLTNAPTAGDFTATMKTSIGTAVAASAVASVTGNVGGNVTGSVGSVASGGIARASFAADTGLQTIRSNTAQAGASTTITLDASASATDSFYNWNEIYITGGTGVGQVREILGYVGATKVATVRAWTTNPDNTSTFAIRPAISVWDDITASHLTSGSTGSSLNAAGSAGDPWATSLPGAYGAGTAGFIVGTNLNATVSSRMATFTLPTNFSSLAITAGGIVQADVQTWLTHAVTVDANNAPNVSAKYWAGTAITATSIPVATAAGASGVLFIAGTNDHCTIANNLLVSGTSTFTGAVAANGGVTFTNGGGVGFVVSSTSSGSAGMTVTGNGAADGLTITSGGGATGNAMTLTCSATNGDGLHCVASGSGNGIYGQTGTTGSGMLLVGVAGLRAQGTSVAGIHALSTSLSGAGIRASANGTGADIFLTTSGTIVNSPTGGAVAKVDLQTIKTQTVTCSAGVTIEPFVGAANELLVDGSGFVTFNNTSLSGSVGSVAGAVGGIAGTTQTLDALQTALSGTHGAGSWATATGFATPTNVSDSTAAIEAHGDAAWSTATGFAVPGDAMTLTSGGYTAAADALLGRNIAGGSSAGRTVSEALFALRNKVAIATGTMTVYSTDDTTTAWTAAVATDNTADPIVSVDPS